jgi:putative SOS response-associated peptidase YedK
MSSHYETLPSPTLYPEVFHVPAPTAPLGREVWPRQPGVFLRRVELEGDAEGQAARELVAGQFGLVPRWVKSASDAKLRSTKLVNARGDGVTTSSNFREAWLAGQRCIVPMMAFMVDDWRSGKAQPTRIARVDGKPMGVAGLWERWTGADGEVIMSYALLTVNANSHALMNRYQQAGSEKNMPAILNEGGLEAWLTAPVAKAREFLRAYPAQQLLANPVEKKR